MNNYQDNYYRTNPRRDAKCSPMLWGDRHKYYFNRNNTNNIEGFSNMNNVPSISNNNVQIVNNNVNNNMSVGNSNNNVNKLLR